MYQLSDGISRLIKVAAEGKIAGLPRAQAKSKAGDVIVIVPVLAEQ